MLEGNRLLPENKYFELYSPQQLMELSIALSYARQKLNDQILMNKTTDYRVLQKSVKEQMIKRQALQQLAEIPDSFISKKIIKNLFNEPDAVEQQAVADLAQINGVGGLGGVGDATADGESKSSTFAGDDDGDDGDDEFDDDDDKNIDVTRIQNKIESLENLSNEKLEAMLNEISSFSIKSTESQLQSYVQDFEELLIFKEVMSDKVYSFLDSGLTLLEEMIENKNEEASKDEAGTLLGNIEDSFGAPRSNKPKAEPKTKAEPKPKRKVIKTKPPKPKSTRREITANPSDGDPRRFLINTGKKAPNKLNLKVNKEVSGKGYGAYTKPVKKYNLMRGSAMAGNNNKQLLKQIQLN